MPTIKLAKITKKINSISKILNKAVDISVKLKENCSMHDPVFILQGVALENDYNYVVWGDRYYWINNKTFLTNDLMEYSCSLDPLATFHDEIKGTTAFCSYADRAHWRSLIDDPRLGADIEVDDDGTGWMSIDFRPDFNRTQDDIVVIMTAIGSTDTIGGMNKYAMTMGTFLSVLQVAGSTVSSDINSWSLTNFLSNFAAKFFMGGAPVDGVLSVKAVPFVKISDYSMGGGSNAVTHLALGAFDIDVSQSADPIYQIPFYMPFTIFSYPITIPFYNVVSADPDMKPFDFLNLPKYTALRVQHPGGETDINVETLADQGTIYLRFVYDLISGKYVFFISNKEYPGIDGDGAVQGQIAMGTMLASGSGDISIDLTPFLQVAYVPRETDAAVATALGVAKMADTMMYNLESNPQGLGIYHIDEKTGAEKIDPNIFSNSYGTHGYQASGNVELPPDVLSLRGLPSSCSFLFKVDMIYPRIFMYDTGTRLPRPDHYIAYCNEYGWPCFDRLMLSSVTGYCRCEGASFHSTHPTVGATPQDISTINGFLNSGIIIEN